MIKLTIKQINILPYSRSDNLNFLINSNSRENEERRKIIKEIYFLEKIIYF
jgi:hypothetical protein